VPEKLFLLVKSFHALISLVSIPFLSAGCTLVSCASFITLHFCPRVLLLFVLVKICKFDCFLMLKAHFLAYESITQ
jgi:hypothetical protein